MRFVILLTFGALLAPGYALAESPPDYVTRVDRAFVPVKGVERLAVMPIACPSTLDCGKFTAQVTKGFSHGTKMATTMATWIKQVMEKAGIDKLDFETGQILAEALAVDAFAVVDIEQASMDVVGQKNISLYGKETVVERPSVKHVRMHLKIVGKDGADLLKASGEGQVQGMFDSLDEVAVKTFDITMEKALAKN